MLVCALVACDKPAITPAIDAAVAVAPEPVRARIAEDAAATLPDAAPARRVRGPEARAPDNGCIARETHAIAGAQLGLAGYLASPLALAFQHSDNRVALWTFDDGVPVRRWQTTLAASPANAALSCSSARCTLAMVDTRAVLSLLTFDRAGAQAPVVIARGADRRFAPAIMQVGAESMIAYTTTRGETMHTLLVRASNPDAPRDLTPEAHGAAAPTFVLGVPSPTLVVIDARAGMSPLLEIPLDAHGVPGEVTVRTPVSQPTAPPLLLASALRGGEVEVFFTLVGRAAMTAVGRVSLRKAETARPLLSSTGYGALRVAAATSGLRTLVALEVPTAPPPDAPRTLLLKLLDGLRTDDVLRLPGHKPSLAAAGAGGAYVLAWAGDDAVFVDVLACDPS